jgi:hypothetical protein
MLPFIRIVRVAMGIGGVLSVSIIRCCRRIFGNIEAMRRLCGFGKHVVLRPRNRFVVLLNG